MRFKNINDSKYWSNFTKSTLVLIDKLTVQAFILYLRENGHFEGNSVELLDGKWIPVDVYGIENGSGRRNEFLITANGRLLYWPVFLRRAELIDNEEEDHNEL